MKRFWIILLAVITFSSIHFIQKRKNESNLVSLKTIKPLSKSIKANTAEFQHPITSSKLSIPLAFIENQGQWDSDVKFVAQKGPLTTQFKKDSIAIKIDKKSVDDQNQAVVLHLQFENVVNDVQIEGQDPLKAKFNYFLGENRNRWRSNVKGYERIVYQELYDGIDLKVHDANGPFEYDLLLKPGADLNQVKISVLGTDQLSIGANGSLIMKTALGDVRQMPPTTWYELSNGEKEFVEAEFVILDESTYSFKVPERNQELALIIDPTLEYSTLLGGSSLESGRSVYVDPNNGDIIVVGKTNSSDFPTKAAYDPIYNTTGDGYITKLSPNGAGPADLVYSTYLGGTGPDDILTIDVDSSGDIVVAGKTGSADFPRTAGAYDTTFNGSTDGFISKLSAGGSQLLYSTFIGNDFLFPTTTTTSVNAVKTTGFGTIVAAGHTNSFNFPTTAGAYQTSLSGLNFDGFITIIFPAGGGLSDLIYSTFLGGNNFESIHDVTTSGNEIIVAGRTESPFFPTTAGSYEPMFKGPSSGFPGQNIGDGFISCIKPNGAMSTDLMYSTFLGGSDGDHIYSLDVDEDGAVLVTGATWSSDFPTSHTAYDSSFNSTCGLPPPSNDCNSDVFVSRLELNGAGINDLDYSTFLGGSGNEVGVAVEVGLSKEIVVSGWVESFDFPTTPGAHQEFHGGLGTGKDIFIVKLDHAGGDLVYSTFLGGINEDDVEFPSLAIDDTGSVVVSGETTSSNFPTTLGAYDTARNGFSDVFASKVSMLPKGAEKYGESTPSCDGKIAIGVNQIPQVGVTDFSITAYNAPPNSLGILAVSLGQDIPGTPVSGITAHIDLSQILITFSATSDVNGKVVMPPIPLTIPGIQIFAQWVFVNPIACGGLSASNAIDVTIP